MPCIPLVVIAQVARDLWLSKQTSSSGMLMVTVNKQCRDCGVCGDVSAIVPLKPYFIKALHAVYITKTKVLASH